MAYPKSFLLWWNDQPINKARVAGYIPMNLYEALARIAFSGWRARDREIAKLKEQLGEVSPTLFEQICQIILEKFNSEEEEKRKITLKTSFVDDLGADSFDRVELFMAFEDHFNIEIPDEEIEKAKTVKDVIGLIGKKLQ
jgi:acyl carrier protein